MLGLGFGLAVIVGSTLGIGILRTPGLVAGQLRRRRRSSGLDRRRPLHAARRRVPGRARHDAAASGRLLRLRATRVRRHGRVRGRLDRLAHLLRACSATCRSAFAEFVRVPAAVARGRGDGRRRRRARSASSRCSGRASRSAAASRRSPPRSSSSRSSPWSSRRSRRHRRWRRVAPAFRRRRRIAAASIVALQSVVITYGGWQSALYFTEEDRDPDAQPSAIDDRRRRRGDRRSTCWSTSRCWRCCRSATSRARRCRRPTPRRSSLGARGTQIITVLSLISLPPMLNAIMMIGTRILFAMGRDGLFWRRTATVNAGGTPTVATLVTTAVAVVLHRHRHLSAPGRLRRRSSWPRTTPSAASR